LLGTRIRTLAALVVVLAGALALVLPRAAAAPGVTLASVTPTDSVISTGGGTANLRYDGCLDEEFAPQNPYAPYDPCGINATIADGTSVIMRCWTDDEAPTSENKAWTSPRWFYVTADTGNPEDDVSGFLYSALIPVANQVTTPNCAGTDYTYPYPFQPHDSSIGIYDESGGEFTIETFGIATGPAAVYCHVGPAGDPTGGTVTYLGKYTIDAADNLAIKVPFCGSGTQWVGIIASDGIIRYTGPVTIGSSAPPGIVTIDNNGQMTVQLDNFPLGLSYYFCHAGDPSGYPTGGTITGHGSFTVSSPSQSWSSGLCSGSGNYWIGIQATDGNSYYSNETILGPPPAVATVGLPGAVLDKPYSAALKATAGTGSYSWSIASGALPKGLSLAAATGAITGTPKVSGTVNVVAQVIDADGYTADRQLTFRIAALGVKTTALAAGTVHKAYKATLAAYGGKAPLTWSVIAGHLPAGVKLAKSGVISGTPARSGTFTLTVKVTDAASNQHRAIRTLTLTIKK
jgi:hypothetical protein